MNELEPLEFKRFREFVCAVKTNVEIALISEDRFSEVITYLSKSSCYRPGDKSNLSFTVCVEDSKFKRAMTRNFNFFETMPYLRDAEIMYEYVHFYTDQFMNSFLNNGKYNELNMIIQSEK